MQTPTISSEARQRLDYALHHGWANSTRRNYQQAVDHFLRFCDRERIHPSFRFPSHELVLCAYAASDVGEVSWAGGPRLAVVISGVRNLTPKSSRRPLRPPVTLEMMRVLVRDLDLSAPKDLAVAACASTAFWGQCRLGELLASGPCTRATRPRTPDIPLRCHLLTPGQGQSSHRLFLPRTKTQPSGDTIVLASPSSSTHPVPLLSLHLSSSPLHLNTPLFDFAVDGMHVPLSKTCFLRRCNDIWSRSGFPEVTGHCFRIGGTSELLQRGTPPDVVKSMGRWSSDSFLRDWRGLDVIASAWMSPSRGLAMEDQAGSARPGSGVQLAATAGRVSRDVGSAVAPVRPPRPGVGRASRPSHPRSPVPSIHPR